MQGGELQRSLLLLAFLVLLNVPLHECGSYKSGKKKHKPPPKPKNHIPKKGNAKPSPPSGKKGHASPSPPPGNGYSNGNSRIFDVLAFGAKGDGIKDDTKALEAAWQAACAVQSSVVEVPAEFQFLVGPISLSGPCQPNIVFQIDGTIIAPTNFQVWGSGMFQWILFTKLNSITIQGSGIIDGRGSVWWGGIPGCQFSTTKMHKMPTIKPTALRFYGSIGVNVNGITIQNSPQCHLKFDNCISVEVSNVTISSPWNSPNTDGVHLQNSQDVKIHHSSLACGDDCVSIQTGCSNVRVHNVNCGPGHGISIGGLGKDDTKACVSNITVYNNVIRDTMNGVRIKTWQGGQGLVKDVSFSNIQVYNVTIPIVIDQFYCDKMACTNHSSAVAISGVTYQKIRGTYSMKPVHLACSDSIPCTDVIVSGIKLRPVQQSVQLPFCWKTYGTAQKPSIPPISCLNSGKPNSHRIQTNTDAC